MPSLNNTNRAQKRPIYLLDPSLNVKRHALKQDLPSVEQYCTILNILWSSAKCFRLQIFLHAQPTRPCKRTFTSTHPRPKTQKPQPLDKTTRCKQNRSRSSKNKTSCTNLRSLASTHLRANLDNSEP